MENYDPTYGLQIGILLHVKFSKDIALVINQIINFQNNAYKALNGTASKEEMIAMCTALTKFKMDNTAQASTKQALLQSDWITID